MCKIQRTFERCWKRKIGKRKPWFANLTRLRGPKFQNRPKVCQPGWTLEKKKNESQRERKAIKTNAKEEKRIACSGFNCSSVWTNARPECFRNFGIVSLLCSPPPSLGVAVQDGDEDEKAEEQEEEEVEEEVKRKDRGGRNARRGCI